MTTKVILPAGTYRIGDPCYSISDGSVKVIRDLESFVQYKDGPVDMIAKKRGARA